VSLALAKTELDRALALDIVRVTEATAVAAALWRGRGNEAAADEAALESVRVSTLGKKGSVSALLATLGKMTPEQRKAYYDAENQAVDLINGDFYKYAHHVAAHAKGALKAHELLRIFVHYKHVDYYDPALFGRAYDWMKARGMTEGQSQHAALVVG